MKKTAGPLRVGMIGCGNISNAYFSGLQPYAGLAQITACGDIDLGRAKAKAAEHGVAKAGLAKDLLADPEIDLILDLTIPATHATVNLNALREGKHVYSEKPFSLTYKEGAKVLAEAKKRRLALGCAPDTVLGGGIQTCRKLIDEGAIGTPVAATANLLSRGMEHWHPNPQFFYLKGGGPMFDMGPYYLTSLITLLGPAKSVTAMNRMAFKKRLITSQPLNGQYLKVETPTHLTGQIEFAKGPIATVTMSFDVHAHHLPRIEIYGTEGSLSCPDPNMFNGEVLLWTAKTKEWHAVPLTHNGEVGRGIGLAEMALAIQRRRAPRASGELALQVTEIMEAFHTAAEKGRKVLLQSVCRQPVPMAPNLPLGQLE